MIPEVWPGMRRWGTLVAVCLLAVACGGGGETASPPDAGDPPQQEAAAPPQADTSGDDAQEPGSPSPDLEAFKAGLVAALTAQPRDYAALRGMMGEEFALPLTSVATGVPLAPDEAIAAMQDAGGFLPPAATPAYDPNVNPDAVLVATFGGFELSPAVVDKLFFTGWGVDGAGESIVLVGQGEDGSYYWLGAIFEPAGFPGVRRTSELQAFKDILIGALSNRDFGTVASTMQNGLAVHDVGLLTPDDTAVEALRTSYLPPEGAVTEVAFGYYDYLSSAWNGPTFEDVLGQDVRLCCGNTVLVVGAVQVNGWGADGTQQAVLVIVDRGAGQGFTWEGFAVVGG